MQMFDEEIATVIKIDGNIEQKHGLTDDTLQAEAMDEACKMFLTAERKFQKLNANPDSVTDPNLNIGWWDALESVYQRERTVRRLFVGPQADPASNRQYAEFRRLLLQGKSLKANA